VVERRSVRGWALLAALEREVARARALADLQRSPPSSAR
jgi:hypothetical protein